MNWKKRLLACMRIAVSIGLIGWLFYMADTEQLATRLAGSNLLYLGVMFVIVNLGRVLMAFKWRILLCARGIRLPLLQAISIYYRASFWGMLFLPTVGVDALRILELSRQTGRSEAIISSVVVERFLGTVAVALVGLLSLSLFIRQHGMVGWDLLFIGVFLVGSVALLFLLSLNATWGECLQHWLAARRWRLFGRIGQVLQSYQAYAQHRVTLLVFLLLSIVEQFSPILIGFLTAQALQLAIPFWAFLMLIPIIMIIVRLPISVDGIGVREGLYVSLFGLIGVGQTEAFLVGLISSVLWRVSIVPVTVACFLARGLKPEQPDVPAQPAALKE